jgi:hypothetical protein
VGVDPAVGEEWDLVSGFAYMAPLVSYRNVLHSELPDQSEHQTTLNPRGLINLFGPG